MKNLCRSFVLSAVVIAGVAAVSHADIIGFAPGSFNLIRDDNANPPQLIGGGTDIQMTTGGSFQARALWFNQRQSISQFSVAFTFRAVGESDTFNPEGIAFVVQNAGLNAIGSGGVSYIGLPSSVGVTTEVVLRGQNSSSGVYFNGVYGGGSAQTTPVNAASSDPIRVTLNYDGQFLTMSYTDLTTGTTWSPSPSLIGSIAGQIGSSDAYIGFTAGASHAQLFISDFSYAVPTPGGAVLAGLAALTARRRRR